MKIAILAVTLDKGGTERVISILANELVKQHDVKIIPSINSTIAYDFDKKITIDHLSKTNELKSNFRHTLGRLSILKVIKLYQKLKIYNPDIIISFLPGASFRVLILKKLLGNKLAAPTIISERNDPNIEYRNPIIKSLMKTLYKHADGFVFQTDDAKNYFKDIIDCKAKVILNPLDESFIEHSLSKKRKKEIVTVGRLSEQKNQKLLISAFERILPKYPDYTLRIYGEGALQGELRQYISSKKLSKKILLMGGSRDIASQIKESALFVLSSDYEGMPNALMEAMALGIPCISTDCPCGGPKMLIKNNVNGVLTPVNDSSSLAKNIDHILSHPAFAEKLSKNAQSITSRLDRQHITGEWLDFINEVKTA